MSVLDLLSLVTVTYGLTDAEQLGMSFSRWLGYLTRVPMYEARHLLAGVNAALAPHLKDVDRARLARRLRTMAYGQSGARWKQASTTTAQIDAAVARMAMPVPGKRGRVKFIRKGKAGE